MGPTAVGKTSLAMALYEEIPAEIISVDSAQVYKGMNIGTAKPTPEELSKYPHHLIDICDPAEPYSAANFNSDARGLIQQIHQQDKVVILVGGTMLYYRALLQGFHPLPEADENIREKLLLEAEQKGWLHLHQRLEAIDPVAAKRIHPNDPQRIQRALEVFEISGKTLTELQQLDIPHNDDWQVVSIAIAAESREVLRENIAVRFHQMLEQGFEKEVQSLIGRGDLHAALPSIRAVGYRQMWDYLHGNMDREEMIFRAITATRQLAKRQMTWLRSWPNIQWLSASDPHISAKAIKISIKSD